MNEIFGVVLVLVFVVSAVADVVVVAMVTVVVVVLVVVVVFVVVVDEVIVVVVVDEVIVVVVVDDVVVVVVVEGLDPQRCPGPLTQIVTEGTFTQKVLNFSTKVATICISPEEAAVHLKDTDVLRLLTRPEMSKPFLVGTHFMTL